MPDPEKIKGQTRAVSPSAGEPDGKQFRRSHIPSRLTLKTKKVIHVPACTVDEGEVYQVGFNTKVHCGFGPLRLPL